MEGSEKRPRVVTGNTPNKPREKRIRDDCETSSSEEVERPARRTLAFQGKASPLQKVLVILLVHRVMLVFIVEIQKACYM